MTGNVGPPRGPILSLNGSGHKTMLLYRKPKSVSLKPPLICVVEGTLGSEKPRASVPALAPIGAGTASTRLLWVKMKELDGMSSGFFLVWTF